MLPLLLARVCKVEGLGKYSINTVGRVSKGALNAKPERHNRPDGSRVHF